MSGVGRPTTGRAFRTDACGTSAVEFAIVSMPLVLLLIAILQMAIYYIAQSALDAGTVRTADWLVNQFYAGTPVTMPTSAQLRSMVAVNSGGLIHNDASLSVDLRLLATLSGAAVPISNNVDPSTSGGILALRAQASVPVFMPGFSSIAVVRSAALLRRQNN